MNWRKAKLWRVKNKIHDNTMLRAHNGPSAQRLILFSTLQFAARPTASIILFYQ